MRRVFQCAGIIALISIAAPVQAEPATRAQAAEEFTRGLNLARERDYESAISAFHSAYRLAPHHSVLYNMAQAYIGLARPVEALETLERYVAEGAGQLDVTRRTRVSELIAQQQNQIGILEIEVDSDGAEVHVDGRLIGKSPLVSPIRLSRGTHGVTVIAQGKVPWVQPFTVKPRATTKISAHLTPQDEGGSPMAQLEIDCPIPNVDVLVDAQPRGRTPMPAPLLVQSGSRQLQFSRTGYLTREQEVALSAGKLQSIRCQLLPDHKATANALAVHVNPPGASVRVNGAEYKGGRLPLGVHHLQVSRDGFHPWSRLVEVRQRPATSVSVLLKPTASYLDARAAAERTRQYWTIGLGATGLALAGASVGTYLWNSARYADWKGRRQETNAEFAEGLTPELLRRDTLLWKESMSIQRTDYVALSLGMAGVTSSIAALVLWWTGIDQW